MSLLVTQTNSPEIYDEATLVSQAQSGNRWAYGELVRHHRPGLVKLIYRMCGDLNTAEDAAQEAFVRAWQNLNKYQQRAAFRNWLYKIGLNTARNILRQEKPTLQAEDYMILDKKPSPEQSVEQVERAQYIQKAILVLPEASRSVIILREYEGLSYRDIAETLSIPVGTVMSRLSYARQLLRASLSDILEEA